ncbi:MAG: amino acid ABC transporter substrate-binding protein [Pseudomonadota bacterium]
MSRIRILLLLASLLTSSCAHGAGVKVVYPAEESDNDRRHIDLVEILRVALEKTTPEFGPYELKPSSLRMSKARYLSALQERQLINITWSSTSNEMETNFSPIRIPLRKGLLGYRIALIAKEKQAVIDKVQTAEDLRRLTIGQGIDWSDAKLYEAHGIKVVSGKYENLFKMTGLMRFDMFPRGVGEIFTEYELNAKSVPNLAIEKNLLIIYPWPYYFFFNKADAALKQRVEAGLHKMLKDGSFDQIFMKYNRAAIERANLKGRRVIRLQNALLPKETPINDPTMWFDPSKY